MGVLPAIALEVWGHVWCFTGKETEFWGAATSLPNSQTFELVATLRPRFHPNPLLRILKLGSGRCGLLWAQITWAMECAGMRESTSWKTGKRSLAGAMKLRSAAAVLPPLSPPKRFSCRCPVRWRGGSVRCRRCQSPVRHLSESALMTPN